MSARPRESVEAPPARSPRLLLAVGSGDSGSLRRAAGNRGAELRHCGRPRGLEVFLFSFSVGFLWHVSTSLTHPELPIDGFCLLSAPPGGAAGLPAPLQLAAGCVVPVRGAEAALGNDS